VNANQRLLLSVNFEAEKSVFDAIADISLFDKELSPEEELEAYALWDGLCLEAEKFGRA